MNIIELAKQAGATKVDEADPQCWVGAIAFDVDELTRFAALVRAQALEEAAGAIEQTRHPWGGSPKEHYIAAIRQLKQE